MADKEALQREKEHERRRRLRELLELELRGEAERQVSPGKRQLTSLANEGVRRGRAAAEELAAPGKRTMTMALSERLDAEAGRRDWGAVIEGAPLGPEMAGLARRSRGEERREDRERGHEGNGRREADGGEGQGRERAPARGRGRGRAKQEEVEPDDALAEQDAESESESIEGLTSRGRVTVQQGRAMASVLNHIGGPMAQFGDRLNTLSSELDRRINTELSRFRAFPRTPESAVNAAVNENETAGATVASISGTARSARRRLEEDPIVSAASDIASERQRVHETVNREAQTAAADFQYQAARTERQPANPDAGGVEAARDQLRGEAAKVDPTREGAVKLDANGNPIKDALKKPDAPKPD
ncbi:MAG TPA: hypothetical protein VMZ28_20550, partial [Kofleriaceae bacterium]|nr:hypothetical protein [Kofleriaceae bacterium]